MAIKVKFDIPEKIRCAAVIMVTSKSTVGRIAITEETPRAIEMGTPAKRSIAKTAKIIKSAVNAMLILLFLFF